MNTSQASGPPANFPPPAGPTQPYPFKDRHMPHVPRWVKVLMAVAAVAVIGSVVANTRDDADPAPATVGTLNPANVLLADEACNLFKLHRHSVDEMIILLTPLADAH